MPLSYSYRESINYEWPTWVYVYTEVQRGLNKDLADYIFKLNLKSSTRFYGKAVSAKEYYKDYDQAYFIEREEGEIEDLNLQKGEYVITFSGEFDLKDPDSIKLINSRVDRIVNEL